jgi:hypothetical protein
MTGSVEEETLSEAPEKPEREREQEEEGEETPPPEVVREEIARYEIDTFLPTRPGEQERYETELTRLPPEPTGGERSPLPDLRDLIRAMRRQGADAPAAFPTQRPDLERHEFRTLLAATIRKAAGRVLTELGLGAGTELVPLAGKGEERSNYEVVVRLLNRSLNRAAGKPETGSERLRWTLEECRGALGLVEGAVEETRRGLVDLLAKAKGSRQD